MKKAIWWILGIIVALLLIIHIGGSWYFSNVLISRETQTLADSITRMTEAGVTMDYLPTPEEVSITNDDITLTGWYFDNPTDGQCAVLLLHGYTGTRAGTLQYAPLYWDRGCDLLAYDARGHGNSTPAYHTYGYYEKEDAAAAYAWLLQKTGLSADQVGINGVSYGASTSLQMAPLVPDAAFILADAPYQDLRTIVSHQANQQFGSWVNLFVPGAFLISELRTGMDADEVSPRNAIAQVNTPILIIHSLEDEYTPFTNSEGIFANANPATTQLTLNDWGAPHAADIFERPEEYAVIVDEFLTNYAPEFGN
jgi:dipeptidyl aminopeptidase/acylaminoacyl peptidase